MDDPKLKVGTTVTKTIGEPCYKKQRNVQILKKEQDWLRRTTKIRLHKMPSLILHWNLCGGILNLTTVKCLPWKTGNVIKRSSIIIIFFISNQSKNYIKLMH